MSDIGIVIRYNITIKKQTVLETLRDQPALMEIVDDIFELPMGDFESCRKAIIQLCFKAQDLETDDLISKSFNADCSGCTIGCLELILAQLRECMIHFDPEIESIYGQARVALLHAFIWCIVKDDDTEHFYRVAHKWIRKLKRGIGYEHA